MTHPNPDFIVEGFMLMWGKQCRNTPSPSALTGPVFKCKVLLPGPWTRLKTLAINHDGKTWPTLSYYDKF